MTSIWNNASLDSSHLSSPYRLTHISRNIRLTNGTSDLCISFVPRSFRFRFVDILVNIWLLKALFRLKPLPVFLNRFAAPRWVFNFPTICNINSAFLSLIIFLIAIIHSALTYLFLFLRFRYGSTSTALQYIRYSRFIAFTENLLQWYLFNSLFTQKASIH